MAWAAHHLAEGKTPVRVLSFRNEKKGGFAFMELWDNGHVTRLNWLPEEPDPRNRHDRHYVTAHSRPELAEGDNFEKWFTGEYGGHELVPISIPDWYGRDWELKYIRQCRVFSIRLEFEDFSEEKINSLNCSSALKKRAHRHRERLLHELKELEFAGY